MLFPRKSVSLLYFPLFYCSIAILFADEVNVDFTFIFFFQLLSFTGYSFLSLSTSNSHSCFLFSDCVPSPPNNQNEFDVNDEKYN